LTSRIVRDSFDDGLIRSIDNLNFIAGNSASQWDDYGMDDCGSRIESCSSSYNYQCTVKG